MQRSLSIQVNPLNGIRYSPEKCPVAMAIADAAKDIITVLVSNEMALISCAEGNYVCELPLEVRKFIYEFDMFGHSEELKIDLNFFSKPLDK